MLTKLARVVVVVDRNQGPPTMTVYRFPRAGRVRSKTYEVTVGMEGHRTRAGQYQVVAKTRTPNWRAPEWAGADIANKIIPFGDPRNPFEGGFISFEDKDPENNNEGQGFHGTKFDPQIGTHSSHGCVRMRTSDLLEVYAQLKIGTLVVIY